MIRFSNFHSGGWVHFLWSLILGRDGESSWALIQRRSLFASVCAQAPNWSNKTMLRKKPSHLRPFFPLPLPSIYQPSCPSLWCGDPVQCPELKGAKWRVENPRVPLTHRVSSQTLWWMTLIFLSASDHFYVYLDIFLMVFHLSSTDWTRQEGRGWKKRESIKEMERGGVVGSKEKQAAGGQWKTDRKEELARLKLSVNWYQSRNNQDSLLFIFFSQDVKVIVV